MRAVAVAVAVAMTMTLGACVGANGEPAPTANEGERLAAAAPVARTPVVAAGPHADTDVEDHGCDPSAAWDDAPPEIAGQRDEVPLEGAPRLGPERAPVQIVFAADLDCPWCARAFATLRELRETTGDDVAVVWKHNPLPFHAGAVGAGVAVEAAGRQGKFWEMATMLLPHQDLRGRAQYVAWARELGLDVSRFEADLDDPALADHVRRGRKQVEERGGRGAPSFWINGRRMVGAQPLEVFQRLVDEERTARR
jgi:protein-disulfide isomerase